MKRIDVYSPFTSLWFNFDPNGYIPVCASGHTCVLPPFEMIKHAFFGVPSDPNTTTNAKAITLSMYQEGYVMDDDLAFNIASISQFTKIKLL